MRANTFSVLCASLMLASSCASDKAGGGTVTAPPSGNATIFGIYDLVNADGRTPPFVVQEGPTQRIELLAEHVVLGPEGTWQQNGVSQTVYATSTVHDSSLLATGTYATRSDTIYFTKAYPGFGNPFTPYLAFIATLRNDTLFLPVPGPWIWRRRR